MAPGGDGEGVSEYVARILDVIDRSGVPYQLTSMGTILEGVRDRVMGVITACFKALEPDCTRISMNMKVDYRAARAARLKYKTAKIEERLARKLTT